MPMPATWTSREPAGSRGGSRAVRCAGGGQWYEAWENAEIGADRNVPCGWTSYDLATTATRLDSLRDEAVASTGRCPNCGGRVERIPADRAP